MLEDVRGTVIGEVKHLFQLYYDNKPIIYYGFREWVSTATNERQWLRDKIEELKADFFSIYDFEKRYPDTTKFELRIR